MPSLRSPLAQITGLALVMTAFQLIAVIGGFNALTSLPIFVGLFLAYALPVTLVLWIAADMRDHGRTPPFDLPFLLLMAFPISLFWYCISTRGWQGLLLALGLYAVACMPAVATDFVRIALALVSP